MLHAVFHQRDAIRIIPRQERIVSADLLDEAAIAGRSGLGDDDAVVGALLAPPRASLIFSAMLFP